MLKKSTDRMLVLLAGLFLLSGPAVVQAQNITLQPLGTFHAGGFDEGAAEIVAHDPKTQRLFVVNALLKSIDILDISDPSSPTLVNKIDATEFGNSANSVAVKNGLVAVAVEADEKTDPGLLVLFDTEGKYLAQYPTGALPDMVTFTPDGKTILVANEGEPNDDYTVDPKGSVTIIDLRRGRNRATVRTAGFGKFNRWKHFLMYQGVRIYGPNATVAQDLEPEYITVSDNGRKAYVTLQENNAYAEIDIRKAKVTRIVPFGYKKHFLPGNGLDASDRDDGVDIKPWPVYGMYQPDAIAAYAYHGKTFIVSANEGDARDYDGFSEEERVKDVTLDPERFPNAEELREDENLGRLRITSATGDFDHDGDFDRLFSYGARSFSIWSPRHGRQVFDSGDDFEKITAERLPEYFNSNNDDNDSFESRSDDKGPEPEGLALGEIDGRTYAFIGLERISGIMIYDITNPYHPTFIDYVNYRDFSVDAGSPGAGDLGPEGLAFIAAKDSPTGKPLLATGSEISGTVTVYEIVPMPATDAKPEEAIADEEEAASEATAHAKSAMTLFPVPAGNELHIRIDETADVARLSVIPVTVLNRQPIHVDRIRATMTLDLSTCPAGFYVVRGYNRQGAVVYEEKIIRK